MKKFDWNQKRQVHAPYEDRPDLTTRIMRSDKEVIADPRNLARECVDMALTRAVSELLAEHEKHADALERLRVIMTKPATTVSDS